MERIHWSKIWAIMEKRDEKGNPIPFSMTYVKRSTGEVRILPNCTLSSIHSKGSTINAKLDREDTPQSFRKCLIIKFNGLSVYL